MTGLAVLLRNYYAYVAAFTGKLFLCCFSLVYCPCLFFTAKSVLMLNLLLHVLLKKNKL